MSRFYSNKAVTLFNFYAHEQNKLIIIYAVHYLIQLSSEATFDKQRHKLT